MSESLILGEKILSLLDEAALTSTYKPALLVSLVDLAPLHIDDPEIKVEALAEKAIELYWPQTLTYGETSSVLLQNQRTQATIVRDLLEFRSSAGGNAQMLPESARSGEPWRRVLKKVEMSLAEFPIPRLQIPFDNFLYDFNWPWANQDGWRITEYRKGSRSITLRPGVAESLTSLGPLLRPFITRLWTDKAAQLNPALKDASSVVEFERFMFGRNRRSLERIGESLLDLQGPICFFCVSPIAKERDIDHFVPWSASGDDGLDNLVVACGKCNRSKSSTLAGPEHLFRLRERNREWASDLARIGDERYWPQDSARSSQLAAVRYLHSPDERQLWMARDRRKARFESLGSHRARLVEIFDS